MLKRISVHQLTAGMHIKEFCGSWMEHPFLRTSFVLSKPKDIEAILASSIKEVWIDCDKGLDVATGQSAVSEAQSEAQVEAELTFMMRWRSAPDHALCQGVLFHYIEPRNRS